MTRAAVVRPAEARRPPDSQVFSADFPRGLVWIVAGLVTLALMAVTSILFVPHYHVNDDQRMEIIASGREAGGVPDHHLIFTHTAIGYVLSTAYLFAPEIPWYGLYLLGGNWLALTVILRCWLDRRPQWTTLGLFLSTYLVLGLWPTASPQFTVTGWLLGMAGIIALIHAAPRDNASCVWTAAIPGGALLLVSGLVRDQALQMALATALVPTLILVWPLRRQMLFVATTAVVALVLSESLHASDRWLHYSTPEWKQFFSFHRTFSQLMDQRRLVGLENLAQLGQRVGWNDNDIQLLRLWGYWDDQVYTAERIESFRDLVLTEGRYRATTSMDRARAALQTAIPVFPYVVAGWLLSAAGLTLRSTRTHVALITLSLLAATALSTYLVLGPGRFPERVAFPVASAPIFFAGLIPRAAIVPSMQRRVVSVMVILAGLAILWTPITWLYRDGHDAAIRRSTYVAAVREVKQSRSAALVDVDLGDRLSSLPLAPFPRDIEEGVLAWGWHARTPTFIDRCRRAGVPLNHRDMVGNGTLFLVRPRHLAMIQQFLAEHYRLPTRAVADVPLGQIPGYTLAPLSLEELRPRPNAP